jgi:hypothetical protein
MGKKQKTKIVVTVDPKTIFPLLTFPKNFRLTKVNKYFHCAFLTFDCPHPGAQEELEFINQNLAITKCEGEKPKKYRQENFSIASESEETFFTGASHTHFGRFVGDRIFLNFFTVQKKKSKPKQTDQI